MAVAGSSSPGLSIIIPCLGHARELAYCLRALHGQEGALPLEIIVVDSASDSNVRAAIADFPGVHLVRSAKVLSAGAARNLGAASAAADIIAFLDADCIPDPGWARAALQAIQDGAVLASGAILDVLPWHPIAASDNRLQFVDFPKRRPAGVHPYLPATHLVMPRVIFDESGGFDPVARLAQDVLLTAPIAVAQPLRVRFCPRMVVRHWGRQRWNEFIEHQYEFGWSRAKHHLRMNTSLTWLGRHSMLAWLVVLRRLVYITLRVIQWDLLDLPRFILQLPILIAGLIAWARGFYAGMRPSTPAGAPAGDV
jgi:GT2 family glycosyltransferase